MTVEEPAKLTRTAGLKGITVDAMNQPSPVIVWGDPRFDFVINAGDWR